MLFGVGSLPPNLAQLILIKNRVRDLYSSRGPWKYIADSQRFIYSHIHYKIGNGLSTSFWGDCWSGNITLQQLFPSIFQLCTKIEGSVSDFWISDSCTLAYFPRRNLKDLEFQEWTDLHSHLQPYSPNGDDDNWCWNLEKEGLFTTKSLSEVLASTSLDKKPLYNIIWSGHTPKKS